LTLICLGQFMVVLDVSIVNVALPSMRADLGFSANGLQWVVNAYTLVFAGFLLLGGRAADLYGRRRVFVAGLGLFTLASLAGGLAPTPGVLIAARAWQGLGAAVLSPATLTILTTTFTERGARTRALAAWSAVAAAGGAVGNILGGVLTSSLSWRWVLFINIPVGIVLIAAALVLVTDLRGELGRRLDLIGAATATAGLATLVYGIVESASHGWSSTRTLVATIGGLVLLSIFVLVEARFTASPMLPMRLFRAAPVSVGNLLMVLVGATSLTVWYFLSLYLQNVLHYSALAAGLAMTPFALTIIVFARTTARIMPKIGARRIIMVGSVATAAGFGWLAQAAADSDYLTAVLVPGILICAGTGLVFTPITAAVTSRVDRNDAGIVSGLVNASRQIGGSLGLAVMTTVAVSHTQALLTHGDASPVALTDGYDRAFLVGALIAVVTAIAAAALPSDHATGP
jgi:EmrB/QacA subfamily drug resistance transporter